MSRGDNKAQRNLAWVFVSTAALPPTNLPATVSFHQIDSKFSRGYVKKWD